MNEGKIEVSIICNAYNHEKYIADALESFVMQKTSFAFEVLVHDDASTDGTADIIREYEAKYPDIIKPIYQTENQYSKGPISSRFQYPRARGKYIAYCEGDDYWTDPEKLEKQYNALEAHPEIDMCAHSAVIVESETCRELSGIQPSNADVVFSAADVILGGGGFVATNSLFYRKSIMDEPQMKFRECLTLDYTMQIRGALRGGLLYLSDCMSAYRYMAVGSWTVRTMSSLEKRETLYQKKQKMFAILDEETSGKYSEVIKERMLIEEFTHLLTMDKNKAALQKKYKHLFSKLPLSQRVKIRIKAYFPVIVRITRVRNRKRYERKKGI